MNYFLSFNTGLVNVKSIVITVGTYGEKQINICMPVSEKVLLSKNSINCVSCMPCIYSNNAVAHPVLCSHMIVWC